MRMLDDMLHHAPRSREDWLRFGGVAAAVTALGLGVFLHRRSRAAAALPLPPRARSRPARLQLHFDINKTIVMSDVAGGKTTQQMVNCIISEAAWGFVLGEPACSSPGSSSSSSRNNNSAASLPLPGALQQSAAAASLPGPPPPPCSWIPFNSTKTSSDRPSQDVINCEASRVVASAAASAAAAAAAAASARSTTQTVQGKQFRANSTSAVTHESLASASVMSYSDFLELVLLPRDSDPAVNMANKASRNELKSRFTEPGCAGSQWRGEYDVLVSKLALTPAQLEAAATTRCRAELPFLFEKRAWFVIPAFFDLLLALDRSGRDFTLVFRTFGRDLPEVASELNAFCEGRHPCYPEARLDGSVEHSLDLRILPAATTNTAAPPGLSEGGSPPAAATGTAPFGDTGFGAFYRNGPSDAGCFLISGPSSGSDEDRERMVRAGTAGEGYPVVSGFGAISAQIDAMLSVPLAEGGGSNLAARVAQISRRRPSAAASSSSSPSPSSSSASTLPMSSDFASPGQRTPVRAVAVGGGGGGGGGGGDANSGGANTSSARKQHRASKAGVQRASIGPGAIGRAACGGRLRRSIGLSDHYNWWFRNQEGDASGKLLLVDPSAGDGGGDGGAHKIFFDDNVERTYSHIVDVRDVRDGSVIPFADALDTYMVRSQPIEALKDRDYFLKAIERCEERRAMALHRRQQ